MIVLMFCDVGEVTFLLTTGPGGEATFLGVSGAGAGLEVLECGLMYEKLVGVSSLAGGH